MAQMLLWAGLVRVLLFEHFASFAVNLLCHWRGWRVFATNERSTNLALAHAAKPRGGMA
jgi:fatty-acid desaturase